MKKINEIFNFVNTKIIFKERYTIVLERPWVYNIHLTHLLNI